MWTQAKAEDVAEYIATLTDDATLQQATADKYIAAIREKQEKMDAIEALELEDDVAFWNDVKARLAQPVAVETQTEEGATAQAPEATPTPTAMDDVAVQDVEESTPSVESSTSNVESSTSVPESQIESETGNEKQSGEDVNEASNEEVQLSDEVDENGRQFVLNSKGEIVFGEIAEDTGLTPAPILLSEGLITNHATNDGYGLVHIEARHGEQIRNAGYNSVVAFVEEVAKNYERIREGINRDGHQTYMLQLTDKHNNTLMVELSGDGTYWNINTAGIFKTSYGKNRKEVYNRHTTAKQPTETVEVSQDVEQSGTQTSSGMNTPTTSSTAESTTQSSNVQENSVKSGENAQNEGENHFEEESEPGARLTNEVGNEEVTQTNGLNNNIDDNVENNLENGINELNLQQENVSNNGNKDNTPVGGQVPESVPQGEHGEVSSLLGGAQETAARLRERIATDGRASQTGVPRDVREVENRVTREYAKENGLWIPFEDVFKLGYPSKSGNEHDTYLNAEQRVIYKVNNRMNTPSILDLLDRMEQHNKLFPNSKYSLVGFTAVSENGDVWPVFAQDYVPDARMASIEEIDGYMSALGFTRVGDGRYSNGGMLVKDLKPRNVLVNENGDVFVVDAEFEAAEQESGENLSQISENSENEGEKDVIEEMREQNRVAEERQQRAGVPPRMSDYSAAINAEDTEAQKAWEDRFNDYLDKLTADDLSTVESTISRMQGNKEAIKAGNPAGYMENPNYKAFDNIEKMLKKRKRELEKSSTNEEKRQDVEEKSTTGGAQAEQTENANLQTEQQTEPTISQESEQVSETDAEEDDTVLSESEYADARSAEIMADNPNLDDVEAYNMALDEYPKYIGDMINSGKLSKIYKKANIGERIALNKSIQAAGYEISDVNAQEVKEGSKKAESKFKVGDEVTATFGDGSVVSGVIEKIEDGRIKIRSNGRLYPVDESKIGKGVELQQGSLSLESEKPAFKAATEKTMQALEKTGVEVVMATEEQVQAVMEIADDERQMIADANERFNRELQQQIDGTLPKGHIYELGMPSAVLQSAGLPYLPIELAASRLSDKSMQENHPFELSEIEGLVEGVQNPLAVFRSATHVGSFVVLTEIQHNGRNFVAAIETNRRQGRIEINSVRSVHYRNSNTHIANWIVEGLLEYADKKRMSEWFSKQQYNSADVRNLFRHSAKVVESFENPKVSAEFSRVYHGSGAKFDRFDHSFMGMGEGAQAFGWGTYVTEVEGIGRTYATSAARGKNIDYEKTSHAIAEALEKKIGIPTGSLYIMYDGRRLELDVVNGNNIREKLSEYTGIPIDEKDAIRHALAEDAADLIEEYEHIGQRYRYTVEIPDDNGSNYLHWEGVVSDDVIDNLQSELQKNFGEEVAISANLKHGQSGEYLYKKMERALGSDKAASEFLSRAGFVGISYPAQATAGGRADGARNYVIFNENDAQITDRVEFLRTSEGTVYGWAVGGRIYLTPEGVNPNTPVHEYTHLWASAIEQRNPELWAEVVEAVKLSPAWAEVAADEAYRNIWNDDSRMASEVLARLSGGENYRRTMQEAAERENDAARKFSLIAAWGRVKRALAKFWNKVREMLDLPVNGEPGNAVPAWEQFVNSAIGGFYRGVNPNVGNSPMERMMGSRVDARMAQVASELDGRELTTEQQAVADVFGGKADNLTISVKTRDGSERKVVMRQGNEANAGAKHSLFRHYGTNNGTITVDDILLIPEIIANGERTEKKRGNKTVIEYKHTDNNGVEYTVLTEKNKGREEFANFYTNRKASPSARKTRSEEARASNGNASTDKGSNNISNLQEDADIRYRSFGGNSGYVGYSMSKRAAEARREGRYPKTDFKKEYGVSGKSFDFLRKAGIISSSEWHHTSKFGNRTDFFSWSNDTDAEYYAANKKRIDKAINDVEKLKPEYDVMKAIDKYLSEGRSQDEISTLIDEESRQVEPAEKRYKDARNALAEQLEEEFYNYYNEDFYKNYEQKSEAASPDADIRYRATDVDAEAERTDAEITAAVGRLSAELNTPVEIVTNLSTSPDGRKRASKGWYEGGRVYLVLPNAESVQDAVETVLHEVVGHRGLRALFGERFDAMLDDVFTRSSKAVRSAIMERALPLIGRGRDNAIRVATEEYMAEQAERGFDDYSLWDKVRGWFRNMLRSMGLDVEIGDNEIRYMLWRSYRRMKRGETFAEELNNKIMEVRFRNGDGTIAKYESRVNTRGLSAYNAREAFQDEMLALKEFQRIVEEKYGEKIPSYLNVYDYENRMSSVGFREFMTFSEQLYEPLQETIDEMFREGATQEDVTAYLIAKSGLERNRDFSVRDYLAKMQESKETPEGVTDAVAPMTKAEADAKMNEYMAEKARLLAELNAGSIGFRYCLHTFCMKIKAMRYSHFPIVEWWQVKGAGSKVILARPLFFGDFPFFTFKLGKISFCRHKSLMPPDNIPNTLL